MLSETYKILRIIDDYRVVINAGRENGIREGAFFEIFIEGVELRDDSTGESYGIFDYIKDVVVARTVMAKVSICVSAKYILSPLMSEVAATTRPLQVDQTQITGYGFEIDKVIRLGDSVRERDY